jgi:hypothetical protein
MLRFVVFGRIVYHSKLHIETGHHILNTYFTFYSWFCVNYLISRFSFHSLIEYNRAYTIICVMLVQCSGTVYIAVHFYCYFLCRYFTVKFLAALSVVPYHTCAVYFSLF